MGVTTSSRPIPVECAQEAALIDAATRRTRGLEDFLDPRAWERYCQERASYERQFGVDTRWAARPMDTGP